MVSEQVFEMVSFIQGESERQYCHVIVGNWSGKCTLFYPNFNDACAANPGGFLAFNDIVIAVLYREQNPAAEVECSTILIRIIEFDKVSKYGYSSGEIQAVFKSSFRWHTFCASPWIALSGSASFLFEK